MVDIKQTLRSNLPYEAFRLYDVFRTSSADGELDDTVSALGAIDSCIEIGTGNGYSALILAKYCKGIVFTFDVVSRNAGLLWSFFPQLRKKIYRVVGSQKYIDETIKHIKDEADFINLDFAFIDGEHTAKDVKHDYNIVSSVGIKRILFHDMNNWDISNFVLNELKGERLSYLYGYVGVMPE